MFPQMLILEYEFLVEGNVFLLRERERGLCYTQQFDVLSAVIFVTPSVGLWALSRMGHARNLKFGINWRHF